MNIIADPQNSDARKIQLTMAINFIFVKDSEEERVMHSNDWEKFNEITLSEKQEVYSKLNMEEITDADYMHGKRVCKDFQIKHLDEYHDLYLKSDALILADVFENFRKMYLKIYQLDPAKFLPTPGLAWQSASKKTEVKLELLIDVDMLLRFKKELEEEYVMQFIDMQKLITNI